MLIECCLRCKQIERNRLDHFMLIGRPTVFLLRPLIRFLKTFSTTIRLTWTTSKLSSAYASILPHLKCGSILISCLLERIALLSGERRVRWQGLDWNMCRDGREQRVLHGALTMVVFFFQGRQNTSAPFRVDLSHSAVIGKETMDVGSPWFCILRKTDTIQDQISSFSIRSEDQPCLGLMTKSWSLLNVSTVTVGVSKKGLSQIWMWVIREESSAVERVELYSC